MSNDLKKLNRAQMVELLCRMREAVDELSQENRLLRERAEEAEKKCAQLEGQIRDDAALRADMHAVIERIEDMRCSVAHCSDAERRLRSAEEEARSILENARAEAERIREGLRLELSRQRENFIQQCEELLRDQEALRYPLEDRSGEKYGEN